MDVWSAAIPMNNDERQLTQVKMIKFAFLAMSEEKRRL